MSGIEFGKESSNPNEEKAGKYPFEIVQAINALDKAIGNLMTAEKNFKYHGQIKHENIAMRSRMTLEKTRSDLLRLPTLAYLL